MNDIRWQWMKFCQLEKIFQEFRGEIRETAEPNMEICVVVTQSKR